MRRKAGDPGIDLRGLGGDPQGELPKVEPESRDIATPTAKRRFFGRRFFVTLVTLLVVLGVGVLWLNGPGVRWLGPRVAFYFLEEVGLRGDFRVEGTVTGGLSIHDLRLEGDEALALLTIDRAVPRYRLSELRWGRLEGLEVDGAHLEIRVSPSEEDDEEENEPFDWQRLSNTLRQVRDRLVPMDLAVRGFTFGLKREGERIVELASSDARQEAGSGVIHLELGEVTDATGSSWPEQVTEIVWAEESVSVARVDPLPGVSVRDFVLVLPHSDAVSMEAGFQVETGVFWVVGAPGLSAVTLELREGSVRIEEITEKLGIESPVSARITSLSLDVENLQPELVQATGMARVLLEDVAFEDYRAAEVSLDVSLGEDQASLKALGRAFDNNLHINATAPVDRTGGGFEIGTVKGDFSGDDAAQLVAGIRSQIESQRSEDSAGPRREPPTAAEKIVEEVLAPEEIVEEVAGAGAATPERTEVAEPPAGESLAPEIIDREEDGGPETEGDEGEGAAVAAAPPQIAAQDGAAEAIIEDALGTDAGMLPPGTAEASTVTGTFELSFEDNRLRGGTATMRLQPADEADASPVDVELRWDEDQPLAATLISEGLEVTGGYDFAEGSYEGSLNLDQFSNERVERWLDLAGVELEGTVDLSGEWTGSGNFREGVHQGELVLTESSYLRPGRPEITASGIVRYDWPGELEVEGLRLSSSDQTALLDARMADGMLEVERLLWDREGTEMLEASARLPVPEDFSEWRDTLANDPREISLEVESRVLPVDVLAPWLPEGVELDPRSTMQLSMEVSGTFPAPVIDARFEARNLGSPANPELPTADLVLEIDARDGRIQVTGTATAPDFPPANLSLAMPFRPAAWAEDPEQLKSEPFEARAELPRLDVSRFSTLIPGVRQLDGTVTGNILAEGTFENPALRGELRLTRGGLALNQAGLPEVSGIAADVDLNLDRVVLTNLRAGVAGGTMTGGGTLELNGAEPGQIDLELRADHLPILRNDQMILRAGGALRLQGTWDDALVSGTIGVVDSLFYRDIEILPIGRPFTGPAAASLPAIDTRASPTANVPEPFSNWRLNVVLRTDDPFLIRGNLGSGEVDMAIRVGGTIGNPAPDGNIRLRNAMASLPFSRLQIPTGYLRFSPETGLDPALEIRGVSEPRPYRVNIYVHGQLSDPQLILTSSPPLPENEIMTLLATGTTTEGLEDPQAASARAFQLLIEEARRGRLGFARQLRPVLQVLDRVEFNLAEQDPYDSDTFTTATVRFSDRWFLTAGMGAEGNTRLLGIWRISFR
jgi:hypothetical protein